MLVAPRQLFIVSLILIILTRAQPIKNGADSKKEAEDKGALILGKIWNESLTDEEGKKTAVADKEVNTTDSASTTNISKEAEQVVASARAETEDESDKNNTGKAKVHVEYEVAGLGKGEEKKVAKIEQLFGKINDYLVCTYENKDDCDKQLIDKTSADKEAKKLEYMKSVKKEQRQEIKTNPWWANDIRQDMYGNNQPAVGSVHFPQVLIDEPLAGINHHNRRFPIGHHPHMANHYYQGPLPRYPSLSHSMQSPNFYTPAHMNTYHDRFIFPESETPQTTTYRMGYHDDNIRVPLQQAKWVMPARQFPQPAHMPITENQIVGQSAGYWSSMLEEHHDQQMPVNDKKSKVPVHRYRGFENAHLKFNSREEKPVTTHKIQRHQKPMKMKNFKKDPEEYGDEVVFQKKRELPTRFEEKLTTKKVAKEKTYPIVRRGFLTTFSKGWKDGEEKKQHKSRILDIMTYNKADLEEINKVSSSFEDTWKDWNKEDNHREDKNTIKSSRSQTIKVNAMRDPVGKRQTRMNWRKKYEQPKQYSHQGPFNGRQKEVQNPWSQTW